MFFCHNWFWDSILVVIAMLFLPVLSPWCPLMNLGIGYRRLRSYLNVRPLRHGHGTGGLRPLWPLVFLRCTTRRVFVSIWPGECVGTVHCSKCWFHDTENSLGYWKMWSNIAVCAYFVYPKSNRFTEQIWMHLIFRSPITLKTLNYNFHPLSSSLYLDFDII